MDCIKRRNGKAIVPERQGVYDDILESLKGKNLEELVKNDPLIQHTLREGLIKDKSAPEVALAIWSKTFMSNFTEWQGDSAVMIQDGKFFNGQESKPLFSRSDFLASDNIMYQLEEGEQASYEKQLADKEKLTQQQKDIAEFLIELKRKVSSNGLSYFVEGVQGPFKRVSNVVDSTEKDGVFDYYAYQGENPDDYEINRQWGNEADEILTAVILGREPELNNFTEEAALNAIEVFEKLIAENPDSIILTQIPLYNKEQKIAGTTDIILVDPDGQIRIIDLKTSETTTLDYKYDKKWDNAASKKERHTAQQSLYKGLAEYLGLSVVSTHIMPLQINTDGNTTVLEAVEEPMIRVSENRRFYKLGNPLGRNVSEERMELITQMRKMIANRARLDRKSNRRVKAEKLEQLVGLLGEYSAADSILSFVSALYADTKWALDLFDRSINRIEEMKPNEALQTLNFTKNLVDMYDVELLEKLEQNLIDEDVEIQDESPADILFKSIRNIKRLKSKVSGVAVEKIADVIFPNLSTKGFSKEVTDLENRVNIRRKKLQEAGKTTNWRLKFLEARLNRLKAKEQPTKALLIKELKHGDYTDISFLDMNLNSLINQDNNIIAGFMKEVKNKLHGARLKAREFSFEADAAFQKYKKTNPNSSENVAKFNEDILETRVIYEDGERKEVMAFVSPIDYSKYNTERHLMLEKAKTLKPKEARAYRAAWFKENTHERPAEDIVFNGVVIEKGTKTLLEERKTEILKHKKLSKEKLQAQLNSYMASNRSLFRVPNFDKYENPKFLKLQNKKDATEYYLTLIKRYFTDKAALPGTTQENQYIIPAVSKNMVDTLQDGSVAAGLKYWWQNIFQVVEEDVEVFGEQGKIIPVLYTSNMSKDIVSQDVLGSVMMYHMMTEEYKARQELVDFSELLLDQVEGTKPFETRKGQKVPSILMKMAGNQTEDYLKKHGTNYVAAALEIMIDKHIYNKKLAGDNVPVLGKEINPHKIVSFLLNFASNTQIALNPLLSAANALQANAMVLMEAAAGEFFNKKQWADALAEYAKYEANGDFFKDDWTTMNKSLIGQLVDVYDVIQGEYVDKFGRRFTHGKFKRLFSTDTMYKLQSKGEHHVQVTAFIAIMKNTPVKGAANLLDAYELDEFGKLKLKDGVELPDGLIDYNKMNQLHAINKRLHGVYNSFDASIIERHWAGRLLFMYRKFVIPGIKKRFKSAGIDHELGAITEGSYRTFYRLLFTEGQELLNYLTPGSSSNLSNFEKANVKRTLMELALIATTSAMVLATRAIMEGADDEERKKWAYLAYLSYRLNTELGFYVAAPDVIAPFYGDLPIDPQDAWRMLKTPTITYGTVDKALNVIGQAFDPFAKYERNYGIARKGDNKLGIKTLKLFGYTGNTFNPEEALKIYESVTN